MKTRIAFFPIAAALALGANAAQAEGMSSIPGMQTLSKYEPTIALTGGAINAPAANDDSIGVYGLEVNMNVATFQNMNSRIRTHLQVNRVEEGGIRATTVELSPRYTMPMGNSFSAGIGPVIAWVDADNTHGNQNLIGYGAVAGLNYRSGHMYVGLDLRYMNTSERQSVTFENTMLQAKIGYSF